MNVKYLTVVRSHIICFEGAHSTPSYCVAEVKDDGGITLYIKSSGSFHYTDAYKPYREGGRFLGYSLSEATQELQRGLEEMNGSI